MKGWPGSNEQAVGSILPLRLLKYMFAILVYLHPVVMTCEHPLFHCEESIGAARQSPLGVVKKPVFFQVVLRADTRWYVLLHFDRSFEDGGASRMQ